ncbi:MAG TPA: response regulator [Verrucomicrobiae bacterium]|jgi:DNA-binding NtrC family response regulator|nr:response regulator [Verrucomicrobiae bacterium]
MRPRLLVLDDEETIRQILSVFFEGKGYDVTATGVAAEAMSLAELENFDLGIFDINLAGESGLDLLLYFKSNFPALPIIIYTGMEDEDSLDQATFRGANGFLRKTEPLDNLFEAVKSYVRKSEQGSGRP